MQDIDVHGEFQNRVVTLLVMNDFWNSPGASRACTDLRDPTEDSRLIYSPVGKASIAPVDKLL